MFTDSWCSMGSAGWVFMIVMWGALIAAVVWAVSRLFPSPTKPDPLETLDRRLAAGDIDPQTYRQARSELAGTAPHPRM